MKTHKDKWNNKTNKSKNYVSISILFTIKLSFEVFLIQNTDRHIVGTLDHTYVRLPIIVTII